jgi:hypothetical protein
LLLGFVALAAAAAAAPARAHDTWFEARPSVGGELRLALGTGNRFPVRETGIDVKYVSTAGCLGERSGRIALRRVADEAAALLLAPARRPADGEALRCWTQLEPFDLELKPELIEVYFKEIGAGDELRRTWDAMRARGLPWRERYTKHARIDIGGSGGSGGSRTVPMGMDIVRQSAEPPRAGTTLEFQVLRDGAPLAGLPLELRSERASIGVWRRTDAEGRIRVAVPAAGRWLLRGTDLRAAPDGASWVSGFVTLAFDVAPQP